MLGNRLRRKPAPRLDFIEADERPENLSSSKRTRSVRLAQKAARDINASKRLCLEIEEDGPDEADVAEMLLGLSNTPCSSPSTEASDETHAAPRGMYSQFKAPRRRTSDDFLWSQPLQDEDDEEYSEAQDLPRSPVQPEKGSKRVPGRCKCGKRVSAAHPPCKSELMLLCERFRDRFGCLSEGGQPSRIHLNECATLLGVPRRRLYDITIVYEAAEVVQRTGKLSYVWRGTAHLPELVEQLRKEEEAHQPVNDRRGNLQGSGGQERQTTHSLWTLSRKFIRLLLTTEGPIQLTEAAKHLIGDSGKVGKRQQTQLTVERRLYDIGSILSTLDLIKRTYVEGKRQPAFSWNWERRSGQSAKPAAAPLNQADQLTPAATPVISPMPKRESPAAVDTLGLFEEINLEQMRRKGSDTASDQSVASLQSWPDSFQATPVFCAAETRRPNSSLLQKWSFSQPLPDLPPSLRQNFGGLTNLSVLTPPMQLTQLPYFPPRLDLGSLPSSSWSTLCKPTATVADEATIKISSALSPKLPRLNL